MGWQGLCYSLNSSLAWVEVVLTYKEVITVQLGLCLKDLRVNGLKGLTHIESAPANITINGLDHVSAPNNI